MTARRLISGVLLLVAWAAACSAPSHRALLVGVGKYQSTNVDQLKGPVNDIQSLREVLVERWGFRSNDIITLADEHAKRAAVLKELNRLRATSQPGDFVLFYFSGHGTRVEDDGLRLPLPDCTGALVPWDFAGGGTRVTEPFGADYVVAMALRKPLAWYAKLVEDGSTKGRINPGVQLHSDLVGLMLDEQAAGGWAIARLVTGRNARGL